MVAKKEIGLILMLCSIVSESQAISIRLIDVNAGGKHQLSSAQRSAFRIAAAAWEDLYDDPVTVTIHVGFFDPGAFGGPNVLGDTVAQRTTHDYSDVRNRLRFDAFRTPVILPRTSQYFNPELSALNQLPRGSVPLTDINGSRSDNRITMTTANAKALGLSTTRDPLYGNPVPVGVDGRIRFNNRYAGTFSYSGSPDRHQQDFMAVAKHEIGHLLGFVSVTDVQDANAGFSLHPSTLDLWRFGDTDRRHAIASEPRQITAGAAEYYDSQRNNRDLSWGMGAFDPACGQGGGACQASHWRDNLDQLMDPTLANGVTVHHGVDDIHALDYIGYDRTRAVRFDRYRVPARPEWRSEFAFFDLPDCFGEGCDGVLPPDPGGMLDELPAPPSFEELPVVDFAPNLGFLGGLGYQGAWGERTVLGLAEFLDARPNNDLRTIGPADFVLEGEQDLMPEVSPIDELPSTLRNFYFLSENSAGEQFAFRDTMGDAGAEFDPSIGDSGGYRITGILDGVGDGVIGDIDGSMVIKLISEENSAHLPMMQRTFSIQSDDQENEIVVYDAAALGLEQVGLTGLVLQVDTTTGHSQIVNDSEEAIEFAATVISSQAGSLDPSGWTSISHNYDARGDGSVDPEHRWNRTEELPTMLGEEVPPGESTTLDPGQAVGLGSLFAPGTVPDLQIGYLATTPSGNLIPLWGRVEYSASAFAADFDADGDVDGADFLIWQASFGLQAGATQANGDANFDSRVDGQDFLVWQSQLGRRKSADTVIRVPEPAGWLLSTWILVCLATGRWSFQKAPV